MALYNIYEGHILRILLVVTVGVLTLVFSGCIEAAKNETPIMPEQTVVPSAPKLLYVKEPTESPIGIYWKEGRCSRRF